MSASRAVSCSGDVSHISPRLCEGRERKGKLPKLLLEGTAMVQKKAHTISVSVCIDPLESPEGNLDAMKGFPPLLCPHLSPVGFSSSLLLYRFQPKSQPRALMLCSPQRKGFITSGSIFSLASLNLASFVSWSSKTVTQM